MKLKLMSLMIIISLLIAGCSTTKTTSEVTGNLDEVEKDLVLTSFYATEEITKSIVGNNLEVKSIIPLGVKLHDYEPKPSQLVEVANSEIYVSTSGIFEHLEEDILEVANSNISIINSSKGLLLIESEDEHGHEEYHDEYEELDEGHSDEHEESDENHDEHGHEDFSYDPHVWLSIENMIMMTKNIEEELSLQYPELSEEFKANSQDYITQLENLEQKYELTLSSCLVDVVLVNHKAFGYIGEKYGFEQISAAGFSHEIEPSAKDIEHLIEEAQFHNVSVIFSEGGVSERVSETIAREVGAEVLPLYPITLTSEDSYISIMNINLENLAKGLKCN